MALVEKMKAYRWKSLFKGKLIFSSLLALSLLCVVFSTIVASSTSAVYAVEDENIIRYPRGIVDLGTEATEVEQSIWESSVSGGAKADSLASLATSIGTLAFILFIAGCAIGLAAFVGLPITEKTMKYDEV